MSEASGDQAPLKRPLHSRLLHVPWAERKRLLRREAWAAVAASYVFILFAYLWPPDFRNMSTIYVAVAWTAFMIRTFLFHFGILMVVAAAIMAWARAWRLLAATLPLVVVTTGPACWEYHPKPTPIIVGESITVMSVNLLAGNESTGGIVDEIREATPDILLLQEYAPHWHEALQAGIGPLYPHIAYRTRGDSFGAAIYSQRPLEHPVEMDLPLGDASTPQMRAVIRLNGHRVAVYNVHLPPPWGMDYTIETRPQFADLLDVLRAEALPLILGGDFNFTGNSANAEALESLNLEDAHDLGGWGMGTTWPNMPTLWRLLPVRLDHIYLRGGLTCSWCRTGTGAGSDHRPVFADVGFARAQAGPTR